MFAILAYWFQRRRLLNIFSIGPMLKIVESWWPSWIPIGKRFTGLVQDHPMIIPAKSQFNWPGGFSQWKTHYEPWQPCWISNQHQKHKSGRGPSNEHLWQVWFNSVQCKKLTDGRQRTLSHDKSSHGLWPGELIMVYGTKVFNIYFVVDFTYI
jgi:hypothetical protein